MQVIEPKIILPHLNQYDVFFQVEDDQNIAICIFEESGKLNARVTLGECGVEQSTRSPVNKHLPPKTIGYGHNGRTYKYTLTESS